MDFGDVSLLIRKGDPGQIDSPCEALGEYGHAAPCHSVGSRSCLAGVASGEMQVAKPACGSGNFLVKILQRKLAAVEARYGKSDFEKRHYALFALMCIYGIELLPDNILECRDNLLEIFAAYLRIDVSDELYRAASFVLSQNLVHGDALTMLDNDKQPITFAEWGYLGKGKFQRRDFRFDVLTHSSAFSAEGSLFAHMGQHEIFTPIKSYPIRSMSELAAEATP